MKMSKEEKILREYPKYKRFWKTLCLGVLCAFLMVCLILVFQYTHKMNIYDKNLENTVLAENGIYYSLEDADGKRYAEYFDTCLDSYPEFFQKEIRNNWKVVLVPNEDMGDTLGYTTQTNKVIVIRTDVGYYYVKTTIPHELGHAYSFFMGNLASSPKWTSLYNRYAASYDCGEYFKSSQNEFFALCFEEYQVCGGCDYEEITDYMRDILTMKMPENGLFVYLGNTVFGIFFGNIVAVQVGHVYVPITKLMMLTVLFLLLYLVIDYEILKVRYHKIIERRCLS